MIIIAMLNFDKYFSHITKITIDYNYHYVPPVMLQFGHFNGLITSYYKLSPSSSSASSTASMYHPHCDKNH